MHVLDECVPSRNMAIVQIPASWQGSELTLPET